VAITVPAVVADCEGVNELEETEGRTTPLLFQAVVSIGRSIRANPSPNGRGWPAPAGRVRGTASIKAILFICTPHLPLRGTLSRWERDSQIHTSNPHSTAYWADRLVAIWTAVPGTGGVARSDGWWMKQLSAFSSTSFTASVAAPAGHEAPF